MFFSEPFFIQQYDMIFFLFNNMIKKVDERKTEYQPNIMMFFRT